MDERNDKETQLMRWIVVLPGSHSWALIVSNSGAAESCATPSGKVLYYRSGPVLGLIPVK